jgi:hypothetical protein
VQVLPLRQDSLPGSSALQEHDALRPPKHPSRWYDIALSRKVGRGFLARGLACGKSGT